MKQLLSLFILLSLAAGCMPAKTTNARSKSTSATVVEQGEDVANPNQDTTDTSDDDNTNDSGSDDSGTEQDPSSGGSVDLDELDYFCGLIYQNKDNKYYFVDDQDQTKQVSVKAASLSELLNVLEFPDDAYEDVCIYAEQVDGKLDTYKADFASAALTDNPMRDENLEFGFEYCGTVIWKQDLGMDEAVPQIILDGSGIYVLLNDPSGLVPPSSSDDKGCVYSDKARYTDFDIGPKSFIDVQAINLGW